MFTKKKKERLLALIDALDVKAEINPFNIAEHSAKR